MGGLSPFPFSGSAPAETKEKMDFRFRGDFSVFFSQHYDGSFAASPLFPT